MKIEAKAFKRKGSIADMAGSVVLRAESEPDAVQLAELFRQWTQHKGRARQLKEESVIRYCKKNGLRITSRKRK